MAKSAKMVNLMMIWLDHHKGKNSSDSALIYSTSDKKSIKLFELLCWCWVPHIILLGLDEN